MSPAEHRAIVAALHLPAGIPTEQDFADGGGLEDHHDRRGQARHAAFRRAIPASAAKAAAEMPARLGLGQEQQKGQQLGDDQHGHRPDEHPCRQDRILRRPLRKQRKAFREILGPHELRLQRDQDAEHQKHEPERRRQIGADPGQEVQPRHPVQAARRQNCRMLQIALAPAPVADGEVQQRRWAFLVAAAERRRHVDSPSRRAASAPPRRNRG